MSHRFLPMDPGMLDKLYALEVACHPFPWSRQTLASCIGSGYRGEVLIWGGEPVGYYITQTVVAEATLMNICILPQLRGQGLGWHLLTRSLERLWQEEAECCFLEVRAGNAAAIGLYRRAGFEPLAVRKGYYQGESGREDAVIMKLTLER
ncbi:ribosomal-protein-alanine N-acetyltransferase [Ferrimonas sediminicola]|uniref:[Ribosomal protein bS18]-alanine N-acetyltransferase n=1 Tax=Ferrimonas sediminicola TaxID=2569538 RepID=A0A4U1BF31_9GAMM|nr:ribosomal protein S18-alanine N-acetyltransferase [Ferrimonas sediminicola]TKB49495.1 ribosomal-protein-alanine N-acetyltransferase [Ferrimonas sediminicola]